MVWALSVYSLRFQSANPAGRQAGKHTHLKTLISGSVYLFHGVVGDAGVWM